MSTNNDETEFPKLKHKRGLIKAQLTRFSNFLKDFNVTSGNIEEINIRLEKIKPDLESFNEVQMQIEILSKNEVDEVERSEFETRFFQSIGDAKKMISDFQNITISNSNTVSNTPGTNGSDEHVNANTDITGLVKLPPINLPEFHGAYSNWMTFFDIFSSVVHNAQLNDVQKFCYLRSCLKGEAAQLIQSIEISNKNYQLAWDMLKERFENKRLIVHAHIKAIFECLPMKNESRFQLRALLDNLNKNVRSLKILGQPTDQWDTLLIYIAASKLDPVTRREWEEYLNKENLDFPTLVQLTEFLSKRCQFLETLENKNKAVNERGKRDTVLAHLTAGKVTCAFCNKNHLNFQCEKIQKMPAKNLYAEIKKHKLCLNCLRPFHDHTSCKSAGCKHCGRRHHSLLHLFYNQDSNARGDKTENNPNTETSHSQTGVVPTQGENASTATLAMHCLSLKNSQTILPTVQVKILDASGNLTTARAILDSASTGNFATYALASKLKLKTHKFNMPLAGINNAHSNVSKRINATIFSNNARYKCEESFLLVNKITDNLPQVSFNCSNFEIPSNIELADTEFNVSRPVDLLLGASVFFDVLSVGQIKLGTNKPVLQKTKFGWVITGTLNFDMQNKTEPIICNLTVSNSDLHKQIERFWLLERCDTSQTYLLPEDLQCENHFTENYKRLPNGRFEVCLPVKNNIGELGESQTMAIRRFYNLEKRLQQDEILKHDYNNFMLEYERLGHMSPINANDLDTSDLVYYLPHHGVKKVSSSTTKLRVVFDASAKTNTGLSLNDVIMTGPVIQRDLFSIILNARIHNVLLTGDIEKMYRQVSVKKSDRQLQRIVWRPNPQDELTHYTLNTVTYGTASASFLAIRALHQAALNNADRYPEASKAILTSFYVDDLFVGSDSIENAIILKNQIIEILNGACFPLRKFYSNKREVLTDCDKGQLENYDMSDDKAHKTLGLYWHPTSDSLGYSVNLNSATR